MLTFSDYSKNPAVFRAGVDTVEDVPNTLKSMGDLFEGVALRIYY
jgi:hypothetical protein